MTDKSSDDDSYIDVPWHIVDSRLGDDVDTEQHKRHRGQSLHIRSIKHYSHAITKWGAALENFQPLWFAIVICTGGIATILATFPYPAVWQVTLASILYVFEIVLFAIMMVIMLARWIMYPRVALRKALSDPDELGAYAIPPIALLTIAALTASQVSQAEWGGHAFTLVAYVLWWISIAWSCATLFVVLTTLFFSGNQVDRVMTPVLLMAPVSFATAATEAGFISIYGSGASARLAVPMLIVGYFAIGIAFFMAIILYTVYFHGLFAAGWPAPAKRAGLFILIGPCGQLSTAFQLLGESASSYKRIAQYKPSAVHPPSSGTFWRQETANGLDGAGILLALMLLGFGYLCTLIALIGVIDVFMKKQFTYSLVWWSIIFPLVTLTTAWLELAKSMDSPTFRGLTAALTVLIVLIYFINWAFTIRGIINGSLIHGPSQLEKEKDMMRKVQAQSKKEDA